MTDFLYSRHDFRFSQWSHKKEEADIRVGHRYPRRKASGQCTLNPIEERRKERST